MSYRSLVYGLPVQVPAWESHSAFYPQNSSVHRDALERNTSKCCNRNCLWICQLGTRRLKSSLKSQSQQLQHHVGHLPETWNPPSLPWTYLAHTGPHRCQWQGGSKSSSLGNTTIAPHFQGATYTWSSSQTTEMEVKRHPPSSQVPQTFGRSTGLLIRHQGSLPSLAKAHFTTTSLLPIFVHITFTLCFTVFYVNVIQMTFTENGSLCF